MKEKFVGYLRLIDASARPGCPVCRSVIDATRGHLDALVYEHVNDPETRRSLRSSWGFCNWHTWMLEEIQSAAFGAAIIHEDLLRVVIDRVAKLGRRGTAAGTLRARLADLWGFARPPTLVAIYRRRRACPACIEASRADDRYVRTLLTHLEDPELRAAYERSAGLCLPHTLRAVELGPAGAAGELVALTLPKWTALRRTLDRFVRKHDHRNRQPFTEEEAASYTAAFAAISGARGLFGNALHAADARPASPSLRRPRPRDETEPGAGREDFGREELELRVGELVQELAVLRAENERLRAQLDALRAPRPK